ncbi:MAG TPA: hypothetical protein PLQ13_13170, partial [Candidatus Krumholzibacteria bacterium]|nr:hypothetical protein [Candidatus Krumholzibacteria bacterium]
GAEAWENLFLTTPRTSDLVTLTTQRTQARRLWEAMRTFAPVAGAPEMRTQRRDKGTLIAEYAANLDQCVARIVLARTQDEIPRTLRLSAPLAADLGYLAGALRDQGWLVVDEDELDALALPGPCDLLAAAADLLEAAGALRPAVAGETVGDAGDGDDPDVPQQGAPSAASLLGDLPRPAGLPAPAWPPADAIDVHAATLADLAGLLGARPQLAPALLLPSARRRVDSLLSRWGGRVLAELPEDPLWQAWWATLRGDLGRSDPAPDRPLVRLCPATRAPASPVPGTVMLCLGSEEPRQHYRILARCTDAALILYQERSPLGET